MYRGFLPLKNGHEVVYDYFTNNNRMKFFERRLFDFSPPETTIRTPKRTGNFGTSEQSTPPPL